MKRYLVFTCFLSIRQIVLKFVPEYEESMDKNAPFLELLSELAEKKHATPAQISLAWEITKKPYIIPIPGTTKKERVRENIGGLGVELTGQDMLDIEEALGHMDIIGMHS